MLKERPPISAVILTKEEFRDGLEVPDVETRDIAQGSSTMANRVQVNVSQFVVENLIKGWLATGAPGTIKDMCERSIRLWLTVFANIKKEGKTFKLIESQTGHELRRYSIRLDPDLGKDTSASVKQAFMARIGTQIVVSMLRERATSNPETDLLHEVIAAAEKAERLIGDEVVYRLQLAEKVLSAPDNTKVRDLK